MSMSDEGAAAASTGKKNTVQVSLEQTKKKVRECIQRRERKLFTALNGQSWEIERGKDKYYLECPKCCEEKCHAIYFFPSNVDDHGIICCTACAGWFRRWIKRAEIPVQAVAKLSQKEYNEEPRDAWSMSHARSVSLVQFAKDYFHKIRKRKVKSYGEGPHKVRAKTKSKNKSKVHKSKVYTIQSAPSAVADTTDVEDAPNTSNRLTSAAQKDKVVQLNKLVNLVSATLRSIVDLVTEK